MAGFFPRLPEMDHQFRKGDGEVFKRGDEPGFSLRNLVFDSLGGDERNNVLLHREDALAKC